MCTVTVECNDTHSLYEYYDTTRFLSAPNAAFALGDEVGVILI